MAMEVDKPRHAVDNSQHVVENGEEMVAKRPAFVKLPADEVFGKDRARASSSPSQCSMGCTMIIDWPLERLGDKTEADEGLRPAQLFQVRV